MRYTLGQAVKKLNATSHAYGVKDVREAVNRAIETLSGMAGWECLRQVYRFISVGPCFTLPQGAAGLVRACVNGRPMTVRGQDFRFIHSGPGDLNLVPPGFSRLGVKNILDSGESPLIVEPGRPFRVFACSDGTDPAPGLTVNGTDINGKAVSILLHVASAPVRSGTTIVSGQDPDDVEACAQIFQIIQSVTLDPSATAYVTLYAEDADTYERFPIAVYHPSVVSPRFRRYSIPGIAQKQAVELLVEARIEPLPLLKDTDQLPFDGIDPVEWVMNADWCMKSGEIDKAQKYYDRAMQWMKAKEIANDTVQTSIVVNSVYDNSLGELSSDAFNV